MVAGREIYRINEPKTVSETLDGEAIVINLETGSYYSMNPSGSFIWELTLSGHSVRQISEIAGQRYDGNPVTMGKSIAEFLVSLQQAGLIVESNKSEADAPIKWSEVKEAFVIPAVEEYTDMQEMLLADPIHDVTSAGWPHRK